MDMKLWAALAAAGGLALTASQAQATTFAGSWSLDYLQADPGLVLDIAPLNTSFSFTLAPDDPSTPGVNEEIATVDLFKIYTTESSIDGDDIFHPGEIALSFNFTEPLPNQVTPIEGYTGGIIIPFVFKGGYLDWDPSHILNKSGQTKLYFGQGLEGILSIYVNGGLYNKADRSLTVSATFDWDKDAPTTVVPEPATWALMIGGFGMAGATLRRRRALALA